LQEKKKKVHSSFSIFFAMCVKKNVFVCVFLLTVVLETPHHRAPQLKERKNETVGEEKSV